MGHKNMTKIIRARLDDETMQLCVDSAAKLKLSLSSWLRMQIAQLVKGKK